MLFDQKQTNAQGNPIMTELGKQVIPGSLIPVNTLFKKSMEVFINELKDDTMAELHFTHYQKRRIKNLTRLNVMIQ